MAHRGYREASRDNWGKDSSETLSHDQIKLGAILRIADACEAMAKNHTLLLHEIAMLKEDVAWLRKTNKHLEGSRAAYKAHLTRMKKKFSPKTTIP